MVFLTQVNCLRSRGPDKYWRKAMYFRLSWKFYGRKRNCFGIAVRYARRALRYSSRARHQRRLETKQASTALLWNVRIQAACEEHKMDFHSFMSGLAESDIALNRKVLNDLAIYEPRTFQSLVEFVRKRNGEVGLMSAISPLPKGVITRGML
ncbi:hypothetical protein ScPMuIL_008070 [Solemya velum]